MQPTFQPVGWLDMTGSLLALLIALLAISVLLWAWRGRRVGDAPHCRRCGFDLRGTPGVSVCNECGADLTRGRAIVYGERQRRPRVALAAGVVLAASIAWVGLSAWSGVDAGQIRRIKPVWLLAWDLDRPTTGRATLMEFERRLTTQPPPPDATAASIVGHLVDLAADPAAALSVDAVEHLIDAHNRGQVPGATLGTLVEPFLALQGDPLHAWSDVRGNLLMVAWHAGRVNRDQLARYVEQAVSIGFQPRPVVRVGDPLPWQIRHSVPRGHQSGGDRPTWRLTTTRYALSAADVELQADDDVNDLSGLSGVGSSSNSGHRLAPEAVAAMPAGEHMLRLAVTTEVALVDGTVSLEAEPIAPPVTLARSLDAPLTIVAADAPDPITPIDPASDPSLAEAIQASIDASGSGTFEPGPAKPPRLTIVDRRWQLAEMRVNFKQPPVPLAMRAVLRDPATGEEWNGGTVTAWAGINLSTGFDFPRRNDAPPIDFDGPAQVVLRPSREAAAESVELTTYWGGEIVLDGVELVRENDAEPTP